VFGTLAHWVAERLTRSGMTLPEWAAKGYKLSAIGIDKRSALAELKPRIPLAHEWYNANGDSRSRGHYPSWEAYWGVLSNRAYYFFHRHAEKFESIRIYSEIAEWPGSVSADGLTLIPPPLPPETGAGEETVSREEEAIC